MPLRFIMWNVQHGSAALIQTPNGKSIAVDLGAGEYFSPLKAIRDAGIYRLDHVTVTHPHMDHIDDILHFDELAPGTFLSPKHLTEDEIRGNNPPLNQEAEDKIQKYLEIRRRYSSPLLGHMRMLTCPRTMVGCRSRHSYLRSPQRATSTITAWLLQSSTVA